MRHARRRRSRATSSLGENPAVGSANSAPAAQGAGATSTGSWCATSSRSRPRPSGTTRRRSRPASSRPRTSAPRSSSCPAAAHTEKDGTFTNTQRLLQWHHKAVEPPGDCRSELWFAYHLGRRIREKLAGSTDPTRPADPRPDLGLPDRGPARTSPTPRRCSQEINGCERRRRVRVRRTPELKDDGSTACGSLDLLRRATPTASTRPRAASRAPSRTGSRRSGAGRGRRTAGSSTTAPRPTRTASRGRSASATSGGTPSERQVDRRATSPTSRPTSRRTTCPPRTPRRRRRSRGDEPFIMQPDGLGWLFAPTGLVDGPLPTHYEPHESPVANPLYGQQANPTRAALRPRRQPVQPDRGCPAPTSSRSSLTTYRLTEHHTAGGMSRTRAATWPSCSPRCSARSAPSSPRERGLEHGGWATIVTLAHGDRGAGAGDRADQAAARSQGRVVHQVGLPYHWGRRGLVTGDAANDLFAARARPQRAHPGVQGGDLRHRAGRRPRGPALPELVDDYRARAAQ